MLWLILNQYSGGINLVRRKELVLNILIIGIMAIIGGALHLYHMIIYSIYYAAFIFGYFLSNTKWLESVCRKKSVYGVAALILVLAWKLGPIDTCGGIMRRSMLNLVYNAVCSMTACIVFYNLFLNIQMPHFAKRYLQETGKYSLAIYLIPVIILPVDYILPGNWTFSSINIAILVISILVNVACYCIGRVLMEIPYLNFILFGKR